MLIIVWECLLDFKLDLIFISWGLSCFVILRIVGIVEGLGLNMRFVKIGVSFVSGIDKLDLVVIRFLKYDVFIMI